jgi:hypothetical protein
MCIVIPSPVYIHSVPTYGTHITVHEITVFSIKVSLHYLLVVSSVLQIFSVCYKEGIKINLQSNNTAIKRTIALMYLNKKVP